MKAEVEMGGCMEVEAGAKSGKGGTALASNVVPQNFAVDRNRAPEARTKAQKKGSCK